MSICFLLTRDLGGKGGVSISAVGYDHGREDFFLRWVVALKLHYKCYFVDVIDKVLVEHEPCSEKHYWMTVFNSYPNA